MAVDRFTRFKALRAILGRLRALVTRLGLPHAQETQARVVRWQQVQVAGRLTSDGIVRGPGDPDSASRPVASNVRPMMGLQARTSATEPPRGPTAYDAQRQEWHAAQQQWVEAQHRVAAALQQYRRR